MEHKFGQAFVRAKIEVQQYKLSLLREEIDENIGQLLSSVKLILGIAGKNLFPLSNTLQTAQETLTTAIKDLNLVSSSMNSEWLESFNLIENLQTEVNRINYWQKVNIYLIVLTPAFDVDHSIQLILFAILIGTLRNCLEYSKAKVITIEINYRHSLEIMIGDDGINFKNRHAMNTLRKKIRSYAKLIGGHIKWSSDVSGERRLQIKLL